MFSPEVARFQLVCSLTGSESLFRRHQARPNVSSKLTCYWSWWLNCSIMQQDHLIRAVWNTAAGRSPSRERV